MIPKAKQGYYNNNNNNNNNNEIKELDTIKAYKYFGCRREPQYRA
jgi:hypothetical protein